MQNGNGAGDELWDEFVREFEKQNAIHEPSAAERAAAGDPPPRPKRRRARTVLAVVLAAVAVGAAAYGFGVVKAGEAAAPTASGVPSASVSALARPSTAQLFPVRLGGYERVATAGGPNCLKDETVGPRLTEMIKESKGCLGVDLALYQDAAKDQFNLVVFEFKDPQDVTRITTELTLGVDDYEVAVQIPPKGSGLRTLPADSGLIQAFSGHRNFVVAGMAQWADGRSTDYQALGDKLSALLQAEGRMLPGS